MKKTLFTGLAILLPVVLTILIFGFLIDFFTSPFVGMIENLVTSIEKTYSLPKGLVVFFARLIILFIICVFILFLGIIARWFFFRSFLSLMNRIVSKIPLVKSIYKITKDIVEAFVQKKDHKAFKRPILVAFPSPKSFCIGFESGEIPKDAQEAVEEPLRPVFIPTAPHPISGYFVWVKDRDSYSIPMSNEEALKFTVSCGIITPDLPENKESSESKS